MISSNTGPSQTSNVFDPWQIFYLGHLVVPCLIALDELRIIGPAAASGSWETTPVTRQIWKALGLATSTRRAI